MAHAIRATIRGRVQGVGFRDATVRRAQELGVLADTMLQAAETADAA
jgi:acylphosphatase